MKQKKQLLTAKNVTNFQKNLGICKYIHFLFVEIKKKVLLFEIQSHCIFFHNSNFNFKDVEFLKMIDEFEIVCPAKIWQLPVESSQRVNKIFDANLLT